MATFETVCRDFEQQLLIEKLQNEGHRCLIIYRPSPIRVSWCNQTTCTNLKEEKTSNEIHKCMSAKQRQQGQLCVKLLEEGHKCLKSFIFNYSRQYVWCGQTTCKKSNEVTLDKTHFKSKEEFKCISIGHAHSLEKEGHECIHIPHDLPIRVNWCGQTSCKNSKKKQSKKNQSMYKVDINFS